MPQLDGHDVERVHSRPFSETAKRYPLLRAQFTDPHAHANDQRIFCILMAQHNPPVLRTHHSRREYAANTTTMFFASNERATRPDMGQTLVLGNVGTQRRARLAPRGFWVPPSEPGVHLSICTGLSIDYIAECVNLRCLGWKGPTRTFTIRNGIMSASFQWIER